MLDEGDSAADRQSRILGLAIREFLIDHLAHESKYMLHKDYWEVSYIQLSEARLAGLFFAAMRVDTIHFEKTSFAGSAVFSGADIRGANFPYEVDFTGATFAVPSRRLH